ncbi:MAG: LysR family transcriptional regulator [Pseudorhodoplanes sp.]|uniref:LysR family transcriptional regulator n=1 Tax=Pseudorhodoplanes sp. TaxID=1934341 RepID=UPI003D0B70B1
MDFRALMYFVQVADAGSITRASVNLRIAQPALTRQIHRLEQDLGSRLLIRESRGVKLTDAGRRLYDHATRILRDVERACDDIKGLAGSPIGRVVLGIPPTLCPVLTPPLFEKLRAEQPRIELKIAENFSSGLRDWLSEGRVDLAVMTGPVQGRKFGFEPLFDEEMVLVTTPGTVAAGKAVDADALASLPLVLSDGLRAHVDKFLEPFGKKATVMTSINAVETMRLMAERGLGATVLPRSVLRGEPQTGIVDLTRIGENGLYRNVIVSWLAARHLSITVQAVLDTICRVAETLRSRGIFALADRQRHRAKTTSRGNAAHRLHPDDAAP